MKILVVCQHFYPENFRINDICFELKKKGHHVTVLTGLPNYPQGKVLKEYRWFKHRKQIVNGVKVKRCSLVGRGTTVIRMGLNYFWFALFGGLKALGLRENYEVVYVYQLSPVTMAFPGIVLKKIKKIPLVIHCLDQWPISVTTGPIAKNSFIFKILHKISVWIYKSADIITISSRSFKQYFERDLRIPATEKGLIYLPSYAEDEYLDIKERDNGVFDIVFAGNIGPAQSCETIVECAKLLKEYSDIKFHLVGDGLNRLNCEQLTRKYHLKNVVFHGYHVVAQMPKFYSLADCFIITMVNNQVVNSTLPAKIQSYMLAAKPIVGAISGEVREVVEEARCGMCTESGNGERLAEIIRENYQDKELLAKWGENGRRYYTTHFDKNKCITDLECVLQNIAKKH